MKFLNISLELIALFCKIPVTQNPKFNNAISFQVLALFFKFRCSLNGWSWWYYWYVQQELLITYSFTNSIGNLHKTTNVTGFVRYISVVNTTTWIVVLCKWDLYILGPLGPCISDVPRSQIMVHVSRTAVYIVLGYLRKLGTNRQPVHFISKAEATEPTVLDDLHILGSLNPEKTCTTLIPLTIC